jgi:hypothetical protein
MSGSMLYHFFGISFSSRVILVFFIEQILEWALTIYIVFRNILRFAKADDKMQTLETLNVSDLKNFPLLTMNTHHLTNP